MAADFQALITDPDYQALPPERQTAIRQDFFAAHIAKDPDFQALPAEKQTAMQNDIVGGSAGSTAPSETQPADFQKLTEPPKTVGEALWQGAKNIPSAVIGGLKQLGKAAITQPEGGFLNIHSPQETMKRLMDLTQGAASGATMGIYEPPPATTEAQAARRTGGSVAGLAVPFTGATKLIGAAGAGPRLAQLAAGAITGGAEPLSRGDVLGAVQGATTGAGSVIPTQVATNLAIKVPAKIIETLANRSQAKTLGGAPGIIDTATRDMTAAMPTEKAGQILQKQGKAIGKAAGGLMEQGKKLVPNDVTVPSAASEQIRELLPETGSLKTAAEAKLQKLAQDLDPTGQYISPSESNLDFRQKVVNAISLKGRNTPEEVKGYLTRLAQEKPGAVSEAQIVLPNEPTTPALETGGGIEQPQPIPEAIGREQPPLQTPSERLINLTRTAQEQAAAAKVATQPAKSIQKIVMGESGYRGSELPLTAKTETPPPPAVGESAQSQPALNYLKALRASQEPLPSSAATPEPTPAQFRKRTTGPGAYGTQAAEALQELQKPSGLTPEQPAGVTFQELTDRRQALNRLYGQARNAADQRLYSMAKAAVDADINKFRTNYPEAVNKYYQGVKDYHENFAPLMDLVNNENPSTVIEQLKKMPVEQVRKSVAALKTGGTEGLAQVQDGIVQHYFENATEHGTFNPKTFLSSVKKPTDVRQLKALMGDRFSEVDNFRKALLDAGADKWGEAHGSGTSMWVRMHIVRAGMGLALGNMFTVASQGTTAGIMYFGPQLFQRLAANSRGAKLLAAGTMVAPGSPQAARIATQLAGVAKAVGGSQVPATVATLAAINQGIQQNAPQGQEETANPPAQPAATEVPPKAPLTFGQRLMRGRPTTIQGDRHGRAMTARHMPLATDKAAAYILASNAEYFSQFSITDSVIIEILGVFNIKMRRDVFPMMGGLFLNAEIGFGIVGLIMVGMMDMLGRKQFTSYSLLHDPAVLINRLSIDIDDFVSSRIKSVDILPFAVAIMTAEKMFLILPDFTARFDKTLPAPVTEKSDVHDLVSSRRWRRSKRENRRNDHHKRGVAIREVKKGV